MRLAWIIPTLLSASFAAGQSDLSATLARKFLEQETKPGTAQGFSTEVGDISIVPEEYIVGAGDAFQIGIIGLPSQEFSATVDHEGNLFIADIGRIEIGKVTLPKALEAIRRTFKTSLKNRYEIYAMLKRCKRPVVTVLGEVSSPGSVRLEGSQRVLDAIKAANLGKLPSFDEANLRQIRYVIGDSEASLDLIKAISAGDNSQNPYLYPGARIEVRGMESTIYVGGAVSGIASGRIPLIPGETLADLMGMVRYGSTADTTYVLHRRPGQEARRIPLGEASSVALADNDVITVPLVEGFGTQDTVSVSGAASRPGTYPILAGRTTADEVIEFAGGPTAHANLRRAFIIRAGKLIPPGASYLLSASSSVPVQHWQGVASSVVRPEINSSLSNVVQNGDYAVIRFEDTPAESVKLLNGDEIHIPLKEEFVYISGNVGSPGAYPFESGAGLSHYIGMAKGYTSKADKANVVVMRYYRGISQVRDPSSIQEGDIIVVPASVEFKRVTQIYLPVIQTLATIGSLILTYIAVSR